MKQVRTSIVTAFAIASLGGGSLVGQVVGAQQEAIDIPIGQIFEIQALAPAGSEANWILTLHGDLVEQSREMVFRTRISKEGNYVLAAEVGGTERVFNLQVRQRRPEDKVMSARPNAIVAFNPPLVNDTLSISQAKQVVSITPLREDVSVLAFDFDVNVDSNGDGKPGNDEDTKNTLFRSEGNPLHVWFVGATKRTIRLGTLLTSGQTSFTNISVESKGLTGRPGNTNRPQGNRPQTGSQPNEKSDLKIMVLNNDNGEVEFSMRLPAEQEDPLLLLWDFGDGSQSMLDRPIHSYSKSGKFTVNVEVRDLKTGRVLETVSDAVQVNKLSEEGEDEDAEVVATTDDDDDGKKKEEKKEKKDKGEKKEGSGLLGLVVKLLLSLLGSSILGALIFFFINKMKSRGMSLEKAMEKAEETLVKNQQDGLTDAAPPMEITAEEVPSAAAEPPAGPPTPEPPTPTPEPEPAAPEPPAPAPEPPAPAPEPPAPAPAPEPPAPAPEPATTEEAATPSWLAEGMQQAEASTPTAPPAPPTEAAPPEEGQTEEVQNPA